MLTAAGKQLRIKITMYLDRQITQVEKLKERDVSTSLDRVLREQKKRVGITLSSEILLQISDPVTLEQYVNRIEALELHAKEFAEYDKNINDPAFVDAHKVDAEEIIKEINELRQQVICETLEYAEADSPPRPERFSLRHWILNHLF